MLERPLSYGAARTPPGTLLRGYRGISSLAQLALPLLLRHRIWRGKEDGTRSGERYGIASRERPQGPLTWFHASSVGETNAVLPVIDALAARRPDMTLLLTTGTRTSAGLAGKRLPAGAIHQFVPFDTPRYMRGFLDHWRPGLAILTESEIWPNLVMESAARNIPIILVNARMSKRSHKRWRSWSAVSQPLFESFQLVLAQNQTLGERFRDLGARKVVVAGNLKIDAPPPKAEEKSLAELKRATAGREIFLAASTHPGEEQLVAEAHNILARRHESLMTIIAPRHPHRGEEIAALVRAAGLRAALRSGGGGTDAATDIYVADTIGELGLFYAISPVAFIGGSLVPHGGQNPVEAVKHGAAVLTGPNVGNFEDAFDALRECGGCAEIASAEELAEKVGALLRDSRARKQMLDNGARAVTAMSGALDVTLQALGDWLPPKRA